jgi:hypothetical protein
MINELLEMFMNYSNDKMMEINSCCEIGILCNESGSNLWNCKKC